LAEIQDRLASRGLGDRFQYLGAPERAEKIAFLQSLDVMCLPTALAEGKGLAVLEAWANGVPVVVPAHGVFPEMIAETGGGLLFKPHDVATMAEAIGQLIRDPGLAAHCGRRGQEAVHKHYHADLMAQRTIALYETLRSKRKA
jgi:glycosyltransferase involved in cell wall biosynthesis